MMKFSWIPAGVFIREELVTLPVSVSIWVFPEEKSNVGDGENDTVPTPVDTLPLMVVPPKRTFPLTERIVPRDSLALGPMLTAPVIFIAESTSAMTDSAGSQSPQ